MWKAFSVPIEVFIGNGFLWATSWILHMKKKNWEICKYFEIDKYSLYVVVEQLKQKLKKFSNAKEKQMLPRFIESKSVFVNLNDYFNSE